MNKSQDVTKRLSDVVKLWIQYASKASTIPPFESEDLYSNMNRLKSIDEMKEIKKNILNILDSALNATQINISSSGFSLLNKWKKMLFTSNTEERDLILEILINSNVKLFRKDTQVAWNTLYELINRVLKKDKFDSEIARRTDIWKPHHFVLNKDNKLILEINKVFDDEYRKRLIKFKNNQTLSKNIKTINQKLFKIESEKIKNKIKRRLTEEEMAIVFKRVILGEIRALVNLGINFNENEIIELKNLLSLK